MVIINLNTDALACLVFYSKFVLLEGYIFIFCIFMGSPVCLSWKAFYLWCKEWYIDFLDHFFQSSSFNCSPNNPSLLGMNVGGGVHVKLRLRRPNRDWDFFPYDKILDTMLHELCHNVHGPHNASFYKLWDELRKVLIFLAFNFHAACCVFVEFCLFLLSMDLKFIWSC